MYTNTNTIKLFDANNNLVDDFDARVEEVLKSIHGENYYDIDEELVNTNVIEVVAPEEEIYHDEELEKTIEFVEELVPEDKDYKINIVSKEEAKEKKKISIKDFAPVLFFILIFAVLVFAGYYFLNHFDISSLLNR